MRSLLCIVALLAVGCAAKKDEDYDYIIVGGGLSGSVLANRLSESGKHSVLLLNVAGAPPKAYSGPVIITDEFIIAKNLTADDGLRARIIQPGYEPVPQFSTAKTGSSPARMLGGSSLVALSLYLRDHPEALDAWGEGWSWEDLRPYFHRAEGLEGTPTVLKESDYGQEGPYKVQGLPAYVHPLTQQFIEAAKIAGLPWAADLNTEKGPGVGLTPSTQRADGSKVHAYDAYLQPALGRKNLKLLTGARADRLLLKGDHCHGVAYRNLANASDHVVYAKKEVIVASGYVYTPRLLFLSGLGPKKALEALGMRVVKDLPAVGQNLSSARYSPLAWSTTVPTLSKMMGAPISPAHATPEPEAYASVVVEATARVRSNVAGKANPKSKRADIVLSFMPLYYALESAPLQYSLQGEPWPLKTNAYSILATLGETKAQGSVTFTSASPDVSPVVTHEALTDPYDLELVQEAVRLAKHVGGNLGFVQPVTAIQNGAGEPNTFSALYDGRGSCRMGKHPHNSVVDYKLRVHGVKGLRIVDGSVIPVASPYLAVPEVLALAERASALILDEKRHHVVEEVQSKVSTVTIAGLSSVLGSNFTMMQAVAYLSGAASRELAEVSSPALPPAAALALILGAAMASSVCAVAFARRVGGTKAQGEGSAPLLA